MKDGIVKIGLKSNANFLFSQMNGDTLGGSTGDPFWSSILHVTTEQFEKFKRLIVAFGGNLEKSLTKTKTAEYADIDFECYFTK